MRGTTVISSLSYHPIYFAVYHPSELSEFGITANTLFESSIALESTAQRCEQNTGWKPMLHCVVASSLRVHGERVSGVALRDRSNSPENNVA
jgi:hypothetical protein